MKKQLSSIKKKIDLWQEECQLALLVIAVLTGISAFLKSLIPQPVAKHIGHMGARGVDAVAGGRGRGMVYDKMREVVQVAPEPIQTSISPLAAGIIGAVSVALIVLMILMLIKVVKKHRKDHHGVE